MDEDFEKHWARVKSESQRVTHVEFDGRRYPRTPYGFDFPEGAPRCRDCGVEKGQLHVHDRCVVERCPRCLRQALGCECGEPTFIVRARRRMSLQ